MTTEDKQQPPEERRTTIQWSPYLGIDPLLIPNPFLPHTPNAEENKNDGRAHERTKETHTEARSCQWYSLVRVWSITVWW